MAVKHIGKGTKVTQPVTPQSWARSLLKALGVPVTTANIAAIVGWEMHEGQWGATGRYNAAIMHNPLNTTLQYGSGWSNINAVGVKSYPTWQQGLGATVATLKGGYPGIIAALKTGKGASEINKYPGELSKWSGSGYTSITPGSAGGGGGLIGALSGGANKLSGLASDVVDVAAAPVKGINAIGDFFGWFRRENKYGVNGAIRVVEVGTGIMILTYGLYLLTKEAGVSTASIPGGQTVKRITSIAMPKQVKAVTKPVGAVTKALTPSPAQKATEATKKITLKEKPAPVKPPSRTFGQRAVRAAKAERAKGGIT